jgi:Ca2+-transporting ATPase
MTKGISSLEAAQKLKEYGHNELYSTQPKSVWKIALEVVKEPMFLLLIACGVLYMLLGDYKEGVIMVSTISVIIFITFIQHRKTEKALEALKKLSSPRAMVIRDGKELRIPGRNVVPGDWVILNEGDRVPADGLLQEATNLQVDESIMTGESVPVSKLVSSDNNALLSGTLVTKGRGSMIVVTTGQKTQFGQIGSSLETITEDQTPLQKEMTKLIRTLGIVGVALCIMVVIVFYFTRGNFIQSLLNGLSSAMAILPEEFPVVLTIFLALGAWRLSKANVLTRKPSAIETLGSATVLCSDKTGTITQNKMIVAMVSNSEAAYKKEEIEQNDMAREILFCAFSATDPESTDPMEKAITYAHSLTAVSATNPELLKEYSFSHELLAMTRVYRDAATGEIAAFTKGAPETIFSLCKLNSSQLEIAEASIKEIASNGLRVIGVARKKGLGGPLPDSQKDLQLEFVGLLGLEDPIRQEVPAAIQECNEAGIRVIMITGDFPETARNIGQQIGLDKDALITGSEIDQMSDDDLAERIRSISIMARVKPEQKLRIVEALKRDKEIVAMTGDGVNDAPALKAAHIGIAMGNKGTDVAREASSLVLLDDNFTSIVSAIRMGRKIFDNLQKAVSYILAVHIPIIGLTLIPAFLSNTALLLMPLHIVFMELIIDPISSVAFESEEEEKGIMKRPPRNPNDRFFGTKNILISIGHGVLLLLTVLVVLFVSNHEKHSEEEIRALSFSTLILCNLFLVLSKISRTRSFLYVLIGKNHAAKLILLAAFILLLVILFIPSLAQLFSLSNPGIFHFWITLSASLIMLLILEFSKISRPKGT